MKLEVYLWLGLTKYSKEVISCLPEDFVPVYAEDIGEGEEQRGLVDTGGRRKLPLGLSCQGESAETSVCWWKLSIEVKKIILLEN